jgi:hypothetical protein
MASPHTTGVRAEWYCRELRKGDLVVCQTSIIAQQHPWLIAIVEEVGIPNDPRGAVLRAIGTNALCNYGNESFTKVTGVPEKLLWDGPRRKVYLKIHKALREFATHKHRFRGLQFDDQQDEVAYVFVGPHIFYQDAGNPVKPYKITIRFNAKTSVADIVGQMQEQGFGTRDFEPDDGSYTGPMEGCATFTRDSLASNLNAAGFDLKLPK